MKTTRTAHVTRTKLTATTTALAGLALALTACGGGSEAPPDGGKDQNHNTTGQAPAQNVYQFDQARVDSSTDQKPFVSRSGDVTVQLSNELASVLPKGSTMAVDHFTLKAKAFSTGICRLDAGITYGDGGQDTLTAGREGHEDDAPQSNLMSALTGHGVDGDEIVDEAPGDDETTKGSRYITQDLSRITVVKECSKDAEDDLVKLAFPYAQGPQAKGIHSSSDFAYAEIAVIASGQNGNDGASIVITGGTDAELGATGKWAPPKV
ncbi:hypothetical protein [Streptomyces sp. NPDC007083]|uniref:hypothetical protein n=1 Tax=Streptomyces sp. NPDC007083 TaxID=3156913 RepID=UPI0033F31F59